MGLKHEHIETNPILMVIMILVVIIVGGAIEIIPLFFQKNTTQAEPWVKPRNALEVAGRDVYLKEGCYNCHSQMVRPFQAETLRYGPYSTAGEFVFDHPFQWGSKRTGPDLARVGGRYSDEWHRVHLLNPRDVVPESNMPAYAWLAHEPIAVDAVRANMRALRIAGVPYRDEDIHDAAALVKDKTNLDALIAYLQTLKPPPSVSSSLSSSPVASAIQHQNVGE